jgi:hypothetical protein
VAKPIGFLYDVNGSVCSLMRDFSMASWKRNWPLQCTVCLTERDRTVNT